MATTVLNGSNETTILSKIHRSGLHIAHFDTSLSNSNVVQIIRKTYSVYRSMKYGRNMVATFYEAIKFFTTLHDSYPGS
jgi:hypothetical protein